MTLEQFVVWSASFGLLAFAALSIFFLVGLRQRITGRAAFIASLLTTAWFVCMLTLGLRPVTHILEILAYSAWIGLLLRVLGLDTSNWRDERYSVHRLAAAITALIAVAAVGMLLLADADPLSSTTVSRLPAFAKLALCVLGLILVEQVVRNTRRNHQWSLKFVAIGLGTLFGYGFVLYADAMLFNVPRGMLVAPQGFVYGLAAPLLAIASLRNRAAPLNVSVSREFVFRSGMMIATGGYLLLMGGAGYYLQAFGGDWGDVLRVLVTTGAVLTAVVLLFSTQFRSYVRSTVLRNLYEKKYDYRDEWMRVTGDLSRTDPDATLGDAAIHAFAGIMRTASGAIWRLTEEGTFVPLPVMNALSREPFSPSVARSFITFFDKHDWIVDLDQYREDPAQYPDLILAADIEYFRNARLLIPLFIERRLFAVAALGRPAVVLDLGWEDFNILKIIGRQVAGFLALQHADEVLSESKQLRAMNQLSAFVVHDLKTVTAQLSLMLRNAEKHRENPEFVTDMLRTTDNAVTRMNRLLAQLREARTDSTVVRVDLVTVTREALTACERLQPSPGLDAPSLPVPVTADRDRLAAAIGHIVKNAQEATPETGNIQLSIRQEGDWVALEVRDTGCGMSEEFIANELFTPFTTTKGLTGMGIGTYQAREYFRSLGGEVSVKSQLGRGTLFTLRLPVGRSLGEGVAT